MQELVEVIRRDHAVLHDQVRDGGTSVGSTIEAELAFLDLCIGPAAVSLGPQAAEEWTVAREALLEAQRLVDTPSGDGSPTSDLADAVRRHAEQMEQVVLPRLLGELDEETLSDLTASALRRHEKLPLTEGEPVAMRAEVTDAGPDPSRPAGA